LVWRWSHITLFIGLIATAAVYVRPGVRTLKVFRIVMVLFIAIGVLGLYFHFKGNVEFALERDPSLSGFRLVWKSLRGATPALAPGALSQLGLLGLVFTFRHPALASGNEPELENAV